MTESETARFGGKKRKYKKEKLRAEFDWDHVLSRSECEKNSGKAVRVCEGQTTHRAAAEVLKAIVTTLDAVGRTADCDQLLTKHPLLKRSDGACEGEAQEGSSLPFNKLAYGGATYEIITPGDRQAYLWKVVLGLQTTPLCPMLLQFGNFHSEEAKLTYTRRVSVAACTCTSGPAKQEEASRDGSAPGGSLGGEGAASDRAKPPKKKRKKASARELCMVPPGLKDHIQLLPIEIEQLQRFTGEPAPPKFRHFQSRKNIRSAEKRRARMVWASEGRIVGEVDQFSDLDECE